VPPARSATTLATCAGHPQQRGDDGCTPRARLATHRSPQTRRWTRPPAAPVAPPRPPRSGPATLGASASSNALTVPMSRGAPAATNRPHQSDGHFLATFSTGSTEYKTRLNQRPDPGRQVSRSP
jgi:hypothetical protein